MTHKLYAARLELDRSAFRLGVDLVKLDVLAGAKMPLDTTLQEYAAHLVTHRAILAETEQLMQPHVTKQLPYYRLEREEAPS